MFESPYTGHDFVQFGKTKSVLNKRAQELALLFNPPSVLSLEIISSLLNTRGAVNLFTRPRRFGKSLNMDMLKTFFEICTDTSLFEGLEIRKDTKICEQYMGKYPVISISLKDISGASYADA